MKSTLLLLAGFFLVFPAIPCGAATTLPPYDNFSSHCQYNSSLFCIDHTKWLGWESNDNEGLAREAVRQIQSGGGAVQLATYAYGLVTAQTGVPSSSGQRLAIIRNPASVTTMQTTISVNSYMFYGSGQNPPELKAQVGGMFFNAGTRTSGSSKDDVAAEIGLKPNEGPNNVVNVYGDVYECLDDNCNTTNQLHQTDSLGSYSPGQSVTVSIQWDKTNHRFIFMNLTDAKNVKTEIYNYKVSDTKAPGTPVNNSKRLEVTVTVPPSAAARARWRP